MSDDTNIDDILRSIDALLKESEDQDAFDTKHKRNRHEATNDDEPVEPVEDAGVGVAVADACAVEPVAGTVVEDAVETVTHECLIEASDEAAAVVPERESGEEPDVGELNMAVEPETPLEVSSPERVVKRIMLSEAMLVEDTPDLLNFSAVREADDHVAEHDTHETDAVEEDAIKVDCIEVGCIEMDAPERGGRAEPEEPSHGEALDEVPEPGFPVAVEQPLDTERLIGQVSREVGEQLAARLQEMLPALLAESVRKHIVAQLAAHNVQSETEYDTQAD